MDPAPSRRSSSSYPRGPQEGAGEDLVLSVLKSPINHVGTAEKLEESCEFDEEIDSEEERHVFDDGRYLLVGKLLFFLGTTLYF